MATLAEQSGGEEDRKRRNSKTEKMVEIELEPEIIEPMEEVQAAPAQAAPVEKQPKKRKEKPAKAILHNKVGTILWFVGLIVIS